MKLTLRWMVSLPVVALCALLGGTASAHTITPLVSVQQHVQTAARTARPHDDITTINTDNVNLTSCPQGPQANCSVETQLNAGDVVWVHCQIPVSNDPNGGWWSEVIAPYYGDSGWISNAYITGGPGRLAGVPICASK